LNASGAGDREDANDSGHRGIAEAAADVDRELMGIGHWLGENDNWIAGFCRYYRQPIISRDAAFDRVPGLRRLAY
jgi:predicted nucleic acid-binding protein